jgi:hypothetical protein
MASAGQGARHGSVPNRGAWWWHHPLTMARMDRLYGVTMQERGVSRLLSVDLARAAELAEPPRLAAE